MTSYAKKELARYWPVSPELMAQYKDGSHTDKDIFGHFEWCQNGELHRDGDLPAQIDADGSLWWWKNYQLHRDGDLPAYIDAYGQLQWYQNGQLHRICGPAVIHSDDILGWWINSTNITHKVNEWLTGEEWRGTPEQIVEFQLRFT